MVDALQKELAFLQKENEDFKQQIRDAYVEKDAFIVRLDKEVCACLNFEEQL